MATTPKPKKASTAYSPKPMSAFAKEKTAMRGAETQYQINLKKKDAAEAKAKLKKELKPLKESSDKSVKKNPMGLKALPKEGPSTASKVVKAAKQIAGYTPAGMAVKGAKAVVNAARGGMSIKEENKKLAKTMQNIGKADKKKK